MTAVACTRTLAIKAYMCIHARTCVYARRSQPSGLRLPNALLACQVATLTHQPLPRLHIVTCVRLCLACPGMAGSQDAQRALCHIPHEAPCWRQGTRAGNALLTRLLDCITEKEVSAAGFPMFTQVEALREPCLVPSVPQHGSTWEASSPTLLLGNAVLQPDQQGVTGLAGVVLLSPWQQPTNTCRA